MSFKLGNTNIGELYVGSTKIGSAYLGSTKVYEVAAPGPTPVWPPTGSYALCARLYTDSNLNHITVNTVSWNYDSGSSTTYSDSNCTQALSDLSSWNDYSANTVLSTIGQSQYGTYVDIFTNNSSMTPTNFCLILANDRVQTVTDNSWRVTRVEVYKPGSGTIYKNNNSPSKGQWFRGKSGWSTL